MLGNQARSQVALALVKNGVIKLSQDFGYIDRLIEALSETQIAVSAEVGIDDIRKLYRTIILQPGRSVSPPSYQPELSEEQCGKIALVCVRAWFEYSGCPAMTGAGLKGWAQLLDISEAHARDEFCLLVQYGFRCQPEDQSL